MGNTASFRLVPFDSPSFLPTTTSDVNHAALIHGLLTALLEECRSSPTPLLSRFSSLFANPSHIQIYARAGSADGSPPAWSLAEPVGFTSIDATGNRLHAAYVVRAERGKGLGRAMVAAAREAAALRVLWPVAPSAEGLEFARRVMGTSAEALAAWILEGQVLFPLGDGADFTALCADGALAAKARDEKWNVTAVTKAFAEFLVTAHGWESEHALAVSLLVSNDVFVTAGGADAEEGVGEGGSGDDADADEDADVDAAADEADGDGEGDGDDGDGDDGTGSDAGGATKRART
jgi:hypothetical protein